MKATNETVVVKEKPSAGDIVTVQLLACTETEPIKIKRGPRAGETFTKLDWKFRIIEGAGSETETDLYAKTGSQMTTHPDNEFRLFSEALLGGPIPPGQGIDTDDLLGLLAYANVIEEPYEKNGQARVAIKVGSLMPYGDGNSGSGIA